MVEKQNRFENLEIYFNRILWVTDKLLEQSTLR